MKIFLVFLLACSGCLSAADYYVSPTGDDAKTGSLAEPWETFNHAVSQLTAGDTLNLRGGTYAQRLSVSGKQGTGAAPIIIRNHAGESAVIDGTTLSVSTTGERDGLVVLNNCSYIHVQGLTVKNHVTTNHLSVPVGIQIEGSGSGLKVSNCTVTHIWQSSTNVDSNGFGISVYGTSASPIDGIELVENTVHDLRTGQSESLVLNGNVTNFKVMRNHVYNCNNIGIDLIGYEGSAPPAVDRARDGVCSENIVHGINSSHNPGYNGNFTTGGGDESASGIYVDGGTNIIVERNHVYGCNFGIQLASEHASGFTDYITMRNNLIYHNTGPGVIMGGYDSVRGTTQFCKVYNNTLYLNDTAETYSGQIYLQFYLKNNEFKNNILWTHATMKQMIIHYVQGGTAAQRAFDTASNTFDHNVYYCEGGEAGIEFGLNPTGSGNENGNVTYEGLAAWRTVINGDSNSMFINPGFAVATPDATPAVTDFKLTSSSACLNIGAPSPGYTPAPNESDFFGSSRVAGGRVDVGFHEFMTALQTWRDTHFRLPDGGPGANDLDDPDGDGVGNLIEYSQGMNPTVKDAEKTPKGSKEGAMFRFHYRKDAPELSYEVLASTEGLVTWPAATPLEMADGQGNYWRDFSLSGMALLFVRLKVSY